MEKLPRYVDIDYSKYAPDIPEDRLEAYYGLPQQVQFCKESGMAPVYFFIPPLHLCPRVICKCFTAG